MSEYDYRRLVQDMLDDCLPGGSDDFYFPHDGTVEVVEDPSGAWVDVRIWVYTPDNVDD